MNIGESDIKLFDVLSKGMTETVNSMQEKLEGIDFSNPIKAAEEIKNVYSNVMRAINQ